MRVQAQSDALTVCLILFSFDGRSLLWPGILRFRAILRCHFDFLTIYLNLPCTLAFAATQAAHADVISLKQPTPAMQATDFIHFSVHSNLPPHGLVKASPSMSSYQFFPFLYCFCKMHLKLYLLILIDLSVNFPVRTYTFYGYKRIMVRFINA